MKKYRSIKIALASTLLLFGMGATATAQGPIDAYRVNMLGINGTARGQGIGGAVGAVGADPSAIYVNPAGIGLYQRGNFSITYNHTIGKSEVSGPIHESTANSYNKGMLSNLAYNTNLFEFYKNGNAHRFNFGFNYNREYEYNRDYESVARGEIGGYGLADFMALQATSLGVPFKDYLDSSTTNTGADNPFYRPVFPLITMGVNGWFIESIAQGNDNADNSNLFQSMFYDGSNQAGNKQFYSPKASDLQVSERGYKDALDFTFGWGFNDIVYLGASLRMGLYNYDKRSYYREDFMNAAGANVDDYIQLTNNLSSEGTSFGGVLGVLVALGDYGRVGLSYTTPQYMNVKESFSAYAESSNKNLELDNLATLHTYQTQEYDSQYNVLLPGSVTASIMGLLGRYGFISYDYTYRNLGSSKLYTYENTKMGDVTEAISEDYGSESTHRVGAELRATPRLSLRAGFSYTTNPMKASEYKNQPQNGITRNALASGSMPDFILPRDYKTYSGGIGYRFTNRLTGDFAYVVSNRSEVVYPYSGIIVNNENGGEYGRVSVIGSNKNDIKHNVVFTLNYSF